VAAQRLVRLNTESWNQISESANTLTIRATEYDGSVASADWYSFGTSAIPGGAMITSAVFTRYSAQETAETGTSHRRGRGRDG
jgi:hypothetical protein